MYQFHLLSSSSSSSLSVVPFFSLGMCGRPLRELTFLQIRLKKKITSKQEIITHIMYKGRQHTLYLFYVDVQIEISLGVCKDLEIHNFA